MDPQLMWLSDFLETEKEKTRYAARLSLARIVMIELDREGGPDPARIREILTGVIDTAEASLKYIRSLENDPDEPTDPDRG